MAGLVAFVAANLASDFVSGPIGSVVSPWTRELTALANSQYLNLYPPPEQLIKCHNAGLLTPYLFEQGMGWNGIPLGGQNDSKTAAIWSSIVAAAVPAVPTDVAFPLLGSGAWVTDMWELNCKRAGLWDQQVRDWVKEMQYKPTADEAIVQQYLGNFNDQQANDILKFWGLVPGQRLSTLLQLSLPPGIDTTLQLLQQGRVTQADALRWIKATGMRYEPSVLPQINSAVENPPAYQQIMQLARGPALNADYFNRWGLYSNMPAWLPEWATKTGFSYQPLKNAGLPGGVSDFTWGQLLWADSVPRLSPSQVFTMMVRFRPGQPNPFLGTDVTPPSVGLSDVVAAWKAEGFTSQQAASLTALSYRQLTRFDIRAGVATGLLTQLQASQRYQNLGYMPADADMKANIDVIKATKEEKPWIAKFQDKWYTERINQVVEGYEFGYNTPASVASMLIPLGFTQSDVDSAIATSDFRFNMATVREIIGSVEKSFLHGDLSTQSAISILEQAGLQPGRAAAYIQRWTAARTLPHRMGSASHVIDWMRDGLITSDQAAARLANLGIDNADVLLPVADAQTKLQQTQARQAASQMKHAATQANELARIQAEHVKAAQTLIAQRTKIAPAGTLVKWLKAGIITPSQFTEWMAEKGFQGAQIGEYIKSAAPTPKLRKGQAGGSGQPSETVPPASGS